VPLFLQMYEGPNYHADATIMFGTQVENTICSRSRRSWPISGTASMPIRTCSTRDSPRRSEIFQNSLATRFHDSRGWRALLEDGAGADALYLAQERWTEARGRPRRSWHHGDTGESAARVGTRRAGADVSNMALMDEHTYGAYNSVSDPTSREAVDQLEVKEKFAVDAAAQVDFVTRRSMETWRMKSRRARAA